MKNRTCNAPNCRNTQTKNKYGNYSKYCSDECMQINRSLLFKEKYASKSKKDKEAILNRRKSTNLEKYGVENVSHDPAVQKKIGQWHKANATETQAKVKKSNLKKYGVESTNSLPEVKERKKKAFMEKYGVDHQLKIDSVRASVSRKNTDNALERLAKASDTNMERYGVMNASSSPVIKRKRKKTMVERHGAENPSQVAEIHERQFKSRVKKYQMPSGKLVNVQGFEPQALDMLLETISEDVICVGKTKVPEIWYNYNNKRKRYFPDFYIADRNLIIEVKSQWTYVAQSEEVHNINLAKEAACKEQGYGFLFMVFDNRGTELLTEKKWQC